VNALSVFSARELAEDRDGRSAKSAFRGEKFAICRFLWYSI